MVRTARCRTAKDAQNELVFSERTFHCCIPFALQSMCICPAKKAFHSFDVAISIRNTMRMWKNKYVLLKKTKQKKKTKKKKQTNKQTTKQCRYACTVQSQQLKHRWLVYLLAYSNSIFSPYKILPIAQENNIITKTRLFKYTENFTTKK